MRLLRVMMLGFLVLVFSNVMVLASAANSAQISQQSELPRAAQYFLGTTDELLIRVNIWGFVNKPGQYMVPSETDLISLISYAGGPQPLAKLSKIRIVRKTLNSGKDEIIEINVKKFIENGNVKIPALKPDDTIIVKASRWHYFNLSLEYISKVAMLAQVIGWYMYYINR